MVALVDDADMIGFRGAPYPTNVLTAAAESVRDECGWHVAPEVTEIVEEEPIGPVVILHTLRVVSVSAVRDAETGRELTGWHLRRRSGTLFRPGGWPERVEVDLTHGYQACPDGLKPEIAARARAISAGGVIRQESLGARSVTLDPGSTHDPLALYKLPPRP